MSTNNLEVGSFFSDFEAANATFDVARIAGCYADIFMFCGAQGTQCVKKEEFLKVLPKRKDFFKSRGLLSSKIALVDVSALDSKYTLARVVWNMAVARGTGEPLQSQNAASYILSKTEDRLQIVLQIDHQDLSHRLQELASE